MLDAEQSHGRLVAAGGYGGDGDDPSSPSDSAPSRGYQTPEQSSSHESAIIRARDPEERARQRAEQLGSGTEAEMHDNLARMNRLAARQPLQMQGGNPRQRGAGADGAGDAGAGGAGQQPRGRSGRAGFRQGLEAARDFSRQGRRHRSDGSSSEGGRGRESGDIGGRRRREIRKRKRRGASKRADDEQKAAMLEVIKNLTAKEGKVSWGPPQYRTIPARGSGGPGGTGPVTVAMAPGGSPKTDAAAAAVKQQHSKIIQKVKQKVIVGGKEQKTKKKVSGKRAKTKGLKAEYKALRKKHTSEFRKFYKKIHRKLKPDEKKDVLAKLRGLKKSFIKKYPSMSAVRVKQIAGLLAGLKEHKWTL